MHRLLAAANLTPTCLMHYCGFMWAWMFEEHVRAEWPQGRFVLLADMSGLKLGQAVGEGQVGACVRLPVVGSWPALSWCGLREGRRRDHAVCGAGVSGVPSSLRLSSFWCLLTWPSVLCCWTFCMTGGRPGVG